MWLNEYTLHSIKESIYFCSSSKNLCTSSPWGKNQFNRQGISLFIYLLYLIIGWSFLVSHFELCKRTELITLVKLSYTFQSNDVCIADETFHRSPSAVNNTTVSVTQRTYYYQHFPQTDNELFFLEPVARRNSRGRLSSSTRLYLRRSSPWW
jgi:hypothetical protein